MSGIQQRMLETQTTASSLQQSLLVVEHTYSQDHCKLDEQVKVLNRRLMSAIRHLTKDPCSHLAASDGTMDNCCNGSLTTPPPRSAVRPHSTADPKADNTLGTQNVSPILGNANRQLPVVSRGDGHDIDIFLSELNFITRNA